MTQNGFDVPLDTLRLRTSEKWRAYPPDVLPAWVAEMDFALAPPIRAALERALDLGDTGYAWPGELATAFAQFAAAEFDWHVDPEFVFQVPDVMAGISQAILAFTDADAGVVINPPVYAPFFEVLRTLGRRALHAPLSRDEAGRWHIDFDALEKAFASGAQAYVLCSPHNPVGRVWSDADLGRLCELAQRYGVALIADEIHAPLTLSGARFVPLLSTASEAVRCVSVMSASKAWNLAGLKCAVLIAGSQAVRARMNAHLEAIPTEIASRVGQFGVIASIGAFREGRAWLHDLQAHLSANRALLTDLLREKLPSARCVPSEATYLAWVDCSGLELAEEPARYFRGKGRVALEPGAKYGTGGEKYVRLNFGTSSEILREIVDRMARTPR
ncbi:MAG TPA: aminotransferase class I/II-fold pyridoxal phosphate-dependent enzyme [Candidatus Baltobacteraceae bacterium]|nr:aminotransferase class I/II-fold pyridoxal phosphate-dependent enzyme [Candidatus Baltobacteraceae bacterium]